MLSIGHIHIVLHGGESDEAFIVDVDAEGVDAG